MWISNVSHSVDVDLPDVDDLEPSGMTPMERIESARAEWRKKQQFNLEESWTSLNLFDRSQKGRISLDLQGMDVLCSKILILSLERRQSLLMLWMYLSGDILDEYLSGDKAKPSEATIPEESDENQATSDGADG